MTKNRNKIIRYFDNQMSDDEKKSFESEIQRSTNLQKEIENYKLVFSRIVETKEVLVKDDYFNNIVPTFRSKLDNKRTAKSFYIKLAYAGSTLTAVIIAVLVLFIKSPDKANIEDVQQLASQLTSDEVSAAANNYLNDISLSDIDLNSSDTYDSVFTKILGNELNVNSNSNFDFFSSNNTSLAQLEKYINNEEADDIYNEILNKQFFKE